MIFIIIVGICLCVVAGYFDRKRKDYWFLIALGLTVLLGSHHSLN